MAELYFRSYGAFRKERNFDQFCAQPKDLATDGSN